VIKLLKFHATWCAPCKALSKTLDTIKDQIPYEIEEVDIDERSDLATQYGVRGVPTMVLLEDGKESKRAVGNMNGSQLKTFLGV
jgi:thioredoxin-like negative regulator of GroEL